MAGYDSIPLMPVLMEWLAFVARWVHVITAIAWIGSSFYFIALDLGLKTRTTLPQGVCGEAWQVHGGGFYHLQKYLVAPDALPEQLTWFKWESYATWLSGFALLAVTYYWSADIFLVDAERWELSALEAIGISIASLVLGWVVYDGLCRSPVAHNDLVLMVVLYGVIVAMAFGYTLVFPGRAAFVHLGAVTATIMSANVFLVIIRNQKIVVATMKAGRVPDPKYGVIAKQRSTHNNYLTLPVIFLMLSNHYPLAFAGDYNWLIASVVFLMGVSIRYYFNTLHQTGRRYVWPWVVTAGLFGLIILLSLIPLYNVDARTNGDMPADAEAIYDIVQGRCAMCHSAAPYYDEWIVHAPKGVVLDSADHIRRHAWEIYLHAGITTAMPPANVSFMEQKERAMIARWYESLNP